MSETPRERAARLLAEARKNAKENEKPQGGLPPEVRDVVSEILADLKRRLGGEVTVHEVNVEDGTITIDGTSKPSNQPPEPPEDRVLAMHMDFSPLSIITDQRAQDHTKAMIDLHQYIVRQLTSSPPDGQLHRFVAAVGQIVTRAGMAGALLLAGRQGRTGVDSDDLATAMGGAIGGMVLAALRYGQLHPEALTEADGLDDSALTDAVDKFLSGLEPEGDDHTKEED